MRWLVVLILALGLAACGDDEPSEPAAPQTELTVTVDGETRTVTDAAGVTTEELAPVPEGRACTQIFGGDATAAVEGRLNGRAVDARFSLENGCEIARWESVAALLGDPPAGP